MCLLRCFNAYTYIKIKHLLWLPVNWHNTNNSTFFAKSRERLSNSYENKCYIFFKHSVLNSWVPNIQLSRFQIYLFFCLLGCQNSGYYGEDCSLQCPPNCQEGYCSIVDGTCLGCRVGYRGPNCDDRECLVTIVKDYLTIHTLRNYIVTSNYLHF